MGSESSDRGSTPRVVPYGVHGRRCRVGVGTTLACRYISTCGLVAMTSASHAEGRQFDPGQVYLRVNATTRVQYTPGQDRTGDLQRVRLTS
jgi:hypothetical protein